MRTILEDAGFVRIGTSAYEHTGIPPALLTATMNTFWAAVGNPAGAAQNVPAAARFDHVWIYMGQVGGGDLVG
jgi:hypothetical protein